MNIKNLLSTLLLCSALLTAQPAAAALANSDLLNNFIQQMVNQHRFPEAELRKLFDAVEFQQSILDAMAKPAEAKPWSQYRTIFITDTRIDGGVKFWQANQAALKSVERRSGVPAEVIVAIIGVETLYGAHTGKYRVIDALSTLGFAHPTRSGFFLKELEQFLLLTREEHIDPLRPMGSYAGAMGLGQFMPSSFRHFAQDFDQDHKRDIWTNSQDAIASVAQYFVANHWQRGGEVALQVSAKGNAYRKALSKGLKPDSTLKQLRKLQVNIPARLGNNDTGKLLSFPLADHDELWLGLHNFYVITSYNHSPLYAMAVHQLSQAIKQKKAKAH